MKLPFSASHLGRCRCRPPEGRPGPPAGSESGGTDRGRPDRAASGLGTSGTKWYSPLRERHSHQPHIGTVTARVKERLMGEFDGIDFFRGNELVVDPYPYFDHLREKCPVQQEPNHDVVMVTGYEEAVSVYTNTTTFSSCNAVTGPFPGFPVPLEGDDVSDLIEQHRYELPFSDQITVMDHAHAQGAPRAADAADHAEAAARERGLHVAARRPPDRRVHRARRVRVHPRLRRTVHPLRHRRPARRARGGPRVVPPRAAGWAPQGHAGSREHGQGLAHPLAARVPLRAAHRLRRGSPARATPGRADRAWRPPPSRTVRCPR